MCGMIINKFLHLLMQWYVCMDLHEFLCLLVSSSCRRIVSSSVVIVMDFHATARVCLLMTLLSCLLCWQGPLTKVALLLQKIFCCRFPWLIAVKRNVGYSVKRCLPWVATWHYSLHIFFHTFTFSCLQCLDSVGCMTGMVSGLHKSLANYLVGFVAER